ncbi:hypothetical protein V7S43_010846 [Phytophthora oleae]|uniref:Uncharacterized protein n=1 Tax=Phytophthora oleae TaxID=2107226 RepID=A0ABD3FC02_9STRA
MTENASVTMRDDTFPQYGEKSKPGRHWGLENSNLLSHSSNKNENSALVMVMLKDAGSWGEGRSAADFFELLGSFDYPKERGG